MKKIYLVAIVPLVLLLAGCPSEKGGGATTPSGYTVTGKAELGYLNTGDAACSAVALDEDMKEKKEVKPTKFTLDSKSSFSVTMQATKYIQLTCVLSSYRMGEIDPNTMQATITAIGDVTKSPSININIGTTIETDGIKADYKKGADFSKIETAIRGNLFALAKVKTPEKSPSLLTTEDSSIKGLQEWVFGLFRKNRKMEPKDIIKDLKTASMNAKAELPSELQVPSVAVSLGTLDLVTINKKLLAYWASKNISIQEAVTVNVPKSVVPEPGTHHVVLEGENKISMALKATATGYTAKDIRSLFNPTGATEFTFCVVDTSITNCDGVKSSTVQLFTLITDAKARSITSLVDYLSLLPQTLDSTNHLNVRVNVPLQAVLDIKHTLTGFDPATTSILIKGKFGESAKELTLDTDDPEGKYKNADIRSLLNATGDTTLMICLVFKGTPNCDHALDREKQTLIVTPVSVQTVPAGSLGILGTLVGHLTLNGVPLVAGGKLPVTGYVYIDKIPTDLTKFQPLRIDKNAIQNFDPIAKRDIYVESTAPTGAITGLSKSSSLVGTSYEADIHSLIRVKTTGAVQFTPVTICIVPHASNVTCSDSEVAANQKTTIVVMPTPPKGVAEFTKVSSFNGQPLGGTTPIVTHLGKALPISIDPFSLVRFDSTTDKLLVKGQTGTPLELTPKGGKYKNADIRSILEFKTADPDLTLCIVAKTANDCGTTKLRTLRIRTEPKLMHDLEDHLTVAGSPFTTANSVYLSFAVSFIPPEPHNPHDIPLAMDKATVENLDPNDKILLIGDKGTLELRLNSSSPAKYYTPRINDILVDETQQYGKITICVSSGTDCNVPATQKRTLNVRHASTASFNLYIYK